MAIVLPCPCWHKPASPRSSCKRLHCPHRRSCAPVAAKRSTQAACQSTTPDFCLSMNRKANCGGSSGRWGGGHAGCPMGDAPAACLPTSGPGTSLYCLAQLHQAAVGIPHSACCLQWMGTAVASGPARLQSYRPAPPTIKEIIKQLEYLGFNYHWFEMKMSSWGITSVFQSSINLIPWRQHSFCPSDQEQLQITAHLITAWILVMKTKIIN